jgi:hypothetical protein
MGKKNQYSFSKRQRELKKKKKAEEKRARKLGTPDDELLPNEEGIGFGDPEGPLAETDGSEE